MNRLHLSLCYDPIMKCLQMSIKCLLLIMRIFTSDELKGDLDHVYLSHARSNVDRYLRSMHISGSSLPTNEYPSHSTAFPFSTHERKLYNNCKSSRALIG